MQVAGVEGRSASFGTVAVGARLGHTGSMAGSAAGQACLETNHSGS